MNKLQNYIHTFFIWWLYFVKKEICRKYLDYFVHVHPWLFYFSITAILWNGWTKGGSLYCLANNYYPYIHTPNINPIDTPCPCQRGGVFEWHN